MKTQVFLLFISMIYGFCLSQNVLTPETLWKLSRISNGKVSPNGSKILFEITNYNVDENKGNTDIYVFDVESKKFTQLTNTAFSEFESSWLSDTKIAYIAPTKSNLQIFSLDILSAETKQISQINEVEIEGYKFSKDLTKVILIASIDMNGGVKEKHPDLPKTSARIENDLLYRHWNYWNSSAKKHIFLANVSNLTIENELQDLNENEYIDVINPPFSGSEQVSFSADGKMVYYSSKRSKGKAFAESTNTNIFEYNIASKQTKNLSEKNEGYDNEPVVSDDGKFVYWLSMKRNGFEADKNNLIQYDIKTGHITNLTEKNDFTVQSFTLGKQGKYIYLIVPYKGIEQLVELEIMTKKIRFVSDEKQDIVQVLPTHKDFFVLSQSMISPTELFEINLKTGKKKEVSFLNKTHIENLDLPSYEERWVKTTDGKEMLVWLILPPKFDKNKKYPAILYCQGGPQSMVSQFFSYRWNLATFASQGYIVIAPNRRGLPGFGQEWNDAISKDWGGQAIQDYLTAVDELKKEPFIDDDRIGAVGASYGGYSVYYLAGVHQGRFKTFISHCGLFNLESWYGTTEELFFANWDHGGPYWIEANKENYSKNSPHKYVQNWDTPMMVIHGGKDFRVPESEGMQAFQAAKIKGLKTKFLYFPDEGHWIMKPQNSVLWYREFLEWLDSDLRK